MNTDTRFLAKSQNNTVKTIIGSNSRPLRRALCTTLIGIAALWAMLGSTHAQVLYVSQEYPIPGTGTVGKYDANTGAVINSSLITGVIHPAGLALLGNTLYVASAVAGGGRLAPITPPRESRLTPASSPPR